MEKRRLGATDLEITPLVFGGNVFGWTIDEKTSFELLDHFAGSGFNCIDTADSYSRWAPGNSGGESETIIGKWMKSRKKRTDVIIATKVGSDMGNGKKGLSKSYILKACEDSLRRLNTDHIDLYQTHFDEPETPVEETLSAYQQLIKDGKVRWIGASNITPERLKESLAASEGAGIASYQTLQPHYNLYAREEFENGLEPICLGNNLGVITYYSLASGFLTGKYRSQEDFDKSPRGGGMAKFLDDRGKRILAALDKVSGEMNSTPATVALAWLINRPSVTAPIASATSISQLNSLLEAPKLELGAEAIRYLTSESAW
ncbi:MAG: aldo/keto reductase [Flavobacterium sp.]|nr:MAG: aldo/keto reductase [Flavobacterium sp.]